MAYNYGTTIIDFDKDWGEVNNESTGKEVVFEDVDYQELQEWRVLAKEIANYVIDNYKNVE